jgi:hypothetical protein
MRVVYRTILREIEEAVIKAAADNRTIDYIEVSPMEYYELARLLGSMVLRPLTHPGDYDTVLGVRIVKQVSNYGGVPITADVKWGPKK